MRELDALLPSRRHAAATSDTTVQLAVRLPSGLRDRVHQAAAETGRSVTASVSEAVADACDRALDPAADFAARVAASIQRRLAAALDDGSWDDAVEEFVADDPDLAS